MKHITIDLWVCEDCGWVQSAPGAECNAPHLKENEAVIIPRWRIDAAMKGRVPGLGMLSPLADGTPIPFDEATDDG